MAFKYDKHVALLKVINFFFSYMFWSDWGKTAKIEKCSMDGESTSRKILVSQNIIWPNGLTIDYSEDRIWWTDARFGTIESVDLNGGDRKVALRSSRARYTFGISLFQDSIFVAKRQGGRKILKVDKSGGKRSVTLLRYLYGPRGIVVYHPSRQPGTGQNCVLSMCLNMTE